MIEILTFNKINNMGLPVTYWVLSNYSYYNFGQERLEIKLNGYLSKKAYDDNMMQMDSITLYVEGEDFKEYFSNEVLLEVAKQEKTMYCQIYNYIQDKVPELKNCNEACINNNCNKCLITNNL